MSPGARVAPGAFGVPGGEQRSFALACLFLEPTPGRLSALCAAAERLAGQDGQEGWDGVVAALERHGVAVLARRNVERAGACVPDDVRAAWDERVAALTEDARRFRLTLERFVDACAAESIVPTLLKGASLGLDLYEDPALRGQGDIDVLVDGAEVAGAVRAGAAAGLVLPEASLPVWWYRLAHFHLKLRPVSALLREVEVHWALNHPSLLVGPPADELAGRAVGAELDAGGARSSRRVRTLEPLDRLLHLVTHLVSHAHGAPGPPRRATLEAVLAEPAHPLRLKWVLDVHAEAERLAPSASAREVARRASAWGAESELAWTLAWVREALGLAPRAEAWVARVLEHLGPVEPLREVGIRYEEHRPLAGLDFRASSLRDLGRWIAPPAHVLARRGGAGGWRGRAAHAARVVARTGTCAALLPAALVGRSLARRERRRARQAAQAPERVLDVAAAWRASTRPGPGPPRS